MKKHLFSALSVLGVFVLLLLVWQGIAVGLNIPGYLLPTPGAVLKAIIERHNSLLTSLRLTVSAAALGLLGSIGFGVAIAIVFASSRWVRRMFLPYTILLQTVPIVAIAPLILMWTGTGLFSVSLITFIICLAPIIANTTQGLISVDRNLVSLFLMHNASPVQLFWKLRLPHAIPALFVGIRIAAGISIIGAITGELFAGSTSVGEGGLGYSITYASAQIQTDYLFALVAAATVLGFSFYFVVASLEWFFLHNWHESALETQAD